MLIRTLRSEISSPGGMPWNPTSTTCLRDVKWAHTWFRLRTLVAGPMANSGFTLEMRAWETVESGGVALGIVGGHESMKQRELLQLGFDVQRQLTHLASARVPCVALS